MFQHTRPRHQLAWFIMTIAVVGALAWQVPAAHANHNQRASYRTSYHASLAQQQFDLGYREGEHAGYDTGYRDAIAGRCFDDRIRRQPRGCSRQYLQGYRASYCNAYRNGYDRGIRMQRQRQHQRINIQIGHSRPVISHRNSRSRTHIGVGIRIGSGSRIPLHRR